MTVRHHSGHGIRQMASSHAWSYAGAVDVITGDVRPLLAILAGEGMFSADLSWQDDAPCGQADPESWFPDKGESGKEARAVCRSCPSRPDCLRYALDRGEEWGTWGGYSEHERRDVERRLRDGESLAAIIAADDEAVYQRLETVPDPVDRERERSRGYRERNAAKVAAVMQAREDAA